MRSLAVALVFMASASAAAQGAPDLSGHPIVGTWRFTAPDRCVEVYRFRADGTALVTSGEEVIESEFEIAFLPSRKGFYRWVDTIVKGNGKKDCGGRVTEIGRKSTSYIRFDPTGQRFVVCQAENLEACFGPLRRVGGRET